MTIVLLHGMFGSPKNWQVCANDLVNDCDVLVPALPIFEVPEGVDPLEYFGQFVCAQLDRRGISRAVIVGNSLGGHIAAQMVVREPRRVVALVLTGSSGLFEKGFEPVIRRRPERSWLRGKISEVFFDPRHVTEELIDEVDAVIRNRRNLVQLLRLAKAAKRDSLRPFLPRVICPTLLLWGEDDQVTPMSTAREFHRLLPNAELRALRQCGHAPMIEQPEQFNRHLRRFIATVREKTFEPCPMI